MEEIDFDGKMDFEGMEEINFDGKMDFEGMEEIDFDGKMDFEGMEEIDFDGKMDFSEMDQNDEENKLEPTEESDISQEPERETNADNNADHPSSVEQENKSYENLNSESTSTILTNDNVEEEIEELQYDDQNNDGIEEINQEEFDKEIEKELEEGVEAINKYLEQEAEFINAYQDIVTEARELGAERESEGNEPLKTEEEWEKEVETAAYTGEQLYEGLDQRENDSNSEVLSEPSEVTENEKETEQTEELLEPQLSNLHEEFEEGINEIEQHQVEPLIEEALETEPVSIVNEREIEVLQELNLEEQFNEVHEKEETEELIEWHDEQIGQEKELELKTQTDNSKEVKSELEEDFEEGMNEVEQHQVEPLIEEALETEPESIVNEKKIEVLQELNLEEQFNEVHEKEETEELIEWHDEQIEQEKEAELETQTDNSDEILAELEEDLEEGMNEVEQHQVEPLIEEALETEPEPIVDEKEIEELQELNLEEQFDEVQEKEETEDLIEWHDEQIEQEKEAEPETQTDNSKEVESELEDNFEEGMNEVEQHQVEPLIEEALETEPEPIVNEKELEKFQEMELEEQFQTIEFNDFIKDLVEQQEEDKIEQEKKDIEQTQEIITQSTFLQEKLEEQQGELEVEYEEKGEVEQEILNDSEKEDSDQTPEENYENLKVLYRQQTGKRPIYASLETIGFKQWLEQKNEAEKKKEKTKQEQDLKKEKKEEAWKQTLKNKIERAREIDPELKSQLIKLVEGYNELENLIKKYSQLHTKAQRKKLSQTERNELNSLIEALLKLDPTKIELFLGLQEIKRYIDKDDYYYYEYWNSQHHYKVFSHFFTQLSQRYKSIKEVQKKESIEEILVNWIEEASEEEINLEMKVVLIKILENYNELEQLTSNFMKLYKKEQLGQISQSEKSKIRSLRKTLGKLSPVKIELFANIRAIKRYLNDQYVVKSSGEKHLNRILYRFFGQLSQKYKKLRKQEEFKAIIEKYKYTGSWKIVSDDYTQYSRDTLYRLVRRTLGSKEYNKLVETYSNQKRTFKNTNKKVIIPDEILEEIIRIFKSNKFEGWREMSFLYPEYSEKVIWSRVKEKLGNDTYKGIIERKSYRIEIPKNILKNMIKKYKENGSWNKISEKYSDYSLDIVITRVKKYLGEIEYEKLKQTYSAYKHLSLEKVIVPNDTLKEMTEQFKNLHSWIEVSNLYPDYPASIIRKRVKEFLGGIAYRNLVKNYRKGLITRTREIFIPMEILQSKIEDYKQKGNWEEIMNNNDQFSLDTLKRQIKEMIGLDNYKLLINQHSKADNIANLIPNRKINIPSSILDQMIIEYKKLHSWNKVSAIFPEYSTTNIFVRVKEYLGKEEYNKLIQQYTKKIIPSRKIDIPESRLQEIIKEYDKHQSWRKVAENYPFSRTLIKKRVKEYLGEDGYNELIRREVNETQYTQLFYDEKYRVQNAISQILQITDDKIEKPQLENMFENWEDLLIFLKENPKFKFADILSGEIIEEKCLIDLHHINGDKSNDKMRNLVYLIHENHTIISIAQNNWKLLREFFKELLTSNLKSVRKGIIPKSWILGWRSLAIEQGINLPENSYHRRGIIYRTITGKESNVIRLVNFNDSRQTDGRVAIIDIEHTGGTPQQGKIIEIGIAELDINSGEITPIFDSLIREKGFTLKEFSKNYFMISVNNISPKLIVSLGQKFRLDYNFQIVQKILKSYNYLFYWDRTNHTEKEWLKTKGFDVSNLYDFQGFVKSYLKTKKIKTFNFQFVWDYFYNEKEHNNNASKYLREPDYYQNHRAYDDAEHEALLLYYLIKEKQFKLKRQKKIG